jgi:hypothetical protein
MGWLRNALDRFDELAESLVPRRVARPQPVRRPRPALEALEDRTVPSSWIGYRTGSTNWGNAANWDDGKIPFQPGSGSNTAIFDTSSQTIICPYPTGGSLIEKSSCGVNIVLSTGGLTLTQGLDWEGDGTILTAPGEDLTLQGAGTWTNG